MTAARELYVIVALTDGMREVQLGSFGVRVAPPLPPAAREAFGRRLTRAVARAAVPIHEAAVYRICRPGEAHERELVFEVKFEEAL